MLGYMLAWAGGHYHFISHVGGGLLAGYAALRAACCGRSLVAAVALAVSLLATLYPSRAAAGYPSRGSVTLRIKFGFPLGPLVVNLAHEGLAIAVSGPTARPGIEVRPSGHADHLMSMGPILEVREFRKDFPTSHGLLRLFEGLNFEVASGQMTAIVGSRAAGRVPCCT